MKKLLQIAALLVGASTLRASPAVASTKKDVREAVRTYVAAGDARDVDDLERVMHPDFRVLLNMGEAVSVMSKADYVGLAKAKKIGGVPRSVDIEWVRISGGLAFAKAKLESSAASFDTLFTLARDPEGRWRIVTDAVHFAKKS